MEWTSVIVEPLKTLVDRFATFFPRLVGAVVILLVGWLVGRMIRTAVVRVLRAFGLDRLSDKTKLSEILRRGAIRLSFVELMGHLAYWVILIATVILALQGLGVTVAAEWLERFGYFIPRVMVSIVILLFGMLVASFLGATVRAVSLNAGFPQGHFLGQAIYVTIVLLTVIVALEQLQVVTRTIEVAIYITLAACGLAFALAVGLGSQEFVKQFFADLWERWRTSRRT